jgi:thiamine monophosphate kinase
MATQRHIFHRLRKLEVAEGQSLNALIAEACDVGDGLVHALENLLSEAAPYSPSGTYMKARELAASALAAAYADNGHTPDNGAKAA